MAIINQSSLYNETVQTGVTYTVATYIGATNDGGGLQIPTQLSLFIKGATSNIEVFLEVAFCPTNFKQSHQPQNSDFISYETAYTQNVVKSIPSLNDLWYRFKINNTSGSSANITCTLGN